MATLKRTTRSRPKPHVPTLDSLPDLLTIGELMLVARISRTTAYELTRSGELPVMRFGRQIRVPRSALQHLTAGA